MKNKMIDTTADFISSSAMLSSWRKTLKEDSAEGRRSRNELLQAIPSSSAEIEDFINFLESKYAILSLITLGENILSLPRVMDAWEDIELLSKPEKFLVTTELFTHWRSVDVSPLLAQHPIFWHAVHVQALAEDQLVGDISKYLSGRRKDSKEARVNRFLNRMGGQPEQRGYYRLMRNDCRLSAVWWRGHIASMIVSNIENNESVESISEFLHSNVELWSDIAGVAVARLTLLCQPKLMSALIMTLMKNDNQKKLSDGRVRNLFFSQIGGHFHKYNTDFLSIPEIEKVIRSLLNSLK